MSDKHGVRDAEKMIRFSLDMNCIIDRGGYLVYVSDACRNILGYESQELTGRSFTEFVHPDDHAKTLQLGKDVIKGFKTSYFENRYIHKQGHEVPIQWSVVWSEEDEVIYCVGRDATEQKLARQKLRDKDKLHLALVEHGSDMLALLDGELNYIYSGSSTERALGYNPRQIVGHNAADLIYLIHPDDRTLVQDALKKALTAADKVNISRYRLKNTKGEWRWLETTISNQLQNPAVKALVTSSRDITDRINNRLRLQESEQRFKALFEENPDIVVFENLKGIIIDVNPTALDYFGLEKEEVINRPLADFLPAAALPVCDESLQSALKGSQIKLEIEIVFEKQGRRIFDITKIPVELNKAIVGIYTIAKDVTAVTTSHNIIRQQTRKLNTIFESITDAFFTLDTDWNFTYINSEFDRLLHTDRLKLIGHSIWEVFPKEYNKSFFQHYTQAMETGRSAHFEAFLGRVNKWLEVKAFPSEEGLSVYFNDVTDQVKAQQELEKLSLVASKTTNGVMILDAEGVTEWVNEGFTNLTGYTFEEAVGRTPRDLLKGEETDQLTMIRIDQKRKEGRPFTEEIINYKKSGEKIWLSLDITPVLDEAGKITRFIIIQTDITFRKEAEASQFELTKDLFSQNRDLQQFTYIVSHNLRSPVANVMGLVDMITMVEKDSAVFNESMTYLKTSINRLDTVLKDLNMILSIRDKVITGNKEKVKLTDVCRQAIESLQETLRECDGKVCLDIDEDIYVNGNKAYLYSIFYNLLSNAIKYRSAKRALQVDIKCFGSTASGVIVSFADNGSGFDMNKAGDNIFRLYKRFHSGAEGRGLGLFLVKTHIEAMDGHIEVNSQLNAGTRFLLYLK